MLSLPILAFVLDRIVALVGDEPIFLSEVRQRAIGGAGQRETIERMIDERLEAREAERAHISVGNDEIDSGIKQIAEQQHLTREELAAEVKKYGMTDAAYREEIRRQIITGKLLQLRVRGRVRVTDADARAQYDLWVKEQSAPSIDLRIVALAIPKDASAADTKAKETLAEQIVQQAKSGNDFCALVKAHTDDPTTKNTCGSRGRIPLSTLSAELARVVRPLKPGETAGPILFSEPSAKGYLVVQRAPGMTTLATFESIKEEMKTRAYTEALERARKAWLGELRKPVYIEVKP